MARLGGDEFAILLEDVRTIDEADVAARRLCDALAVPIKVVVPQPGATIPGATHEDGAHEGVAFETGAVLGREIFVKASIGIALSAPGEEPDALLRNADVAMYAAKARGKGQAVHFERSMHEQALTRVRLEEDLLGARWRSCRGETPRQRSGSSFSLSWHWTQSR